LIVGILMNIIRKLCSNLTLSIKRMRLTIATEIRYAFRGRLMSLRVLPSLIIAYFHDKKKSVILNHWVNV